MIHGDPCAAESQGPCLCNAMAEAKLSYTSFTSYVSVDENNLNMSHKYLVKFTAIEWQTQDVVVRLCTVCYISP